MLNDPNRQEPLAESASPQTSVFQQIRRPLGEAVGLTALVYIGGNLTHAPLQIMNLLALFFVIVWVFAWAGKKFFRQAITFSLTLLCLVLATLLAWVIVIHFYEDRWRGWNNEMSASIKDCAPANASCIARALTYDYPEPQPATVSSKLNNDLKAGSYFLHETKIKTMLRESLGIDEGFLGTGFAQPLGTEEYKDARVPEYLCPNTSEFEDSVVTWALNPTDDYLDWTVEELIVGKKVVRKIIEGKEVLVEAQPTNSRAKRDRFLSNIEGRLALTAEVPAVVRFQQLSSSSGSVGHEGAARVFFSHLGAVWKMKLRDAARLSGYSLDSSIKKMFFIWVYLPTHEYEVVPATWKNIVKHIKAERNPWFKVEQKP